jgi:hypothetical protein
MPDPATGQAHLVRSEQVAERAGVEVEIVVDEPEQALESSLRLLLRNET